MTLEHAATGGGYDSVETTEVAVMVTDGDIIVIPDVDPPVVTIAADVTQVVYNLRREAFDLDAASYTVTLEGPTDEPLEVSITLTQDRQFLPAVELVRTVTIPSGAASAQLEIAQTEFTGSAGADGMLTATVAAAGPYSVGFPAAASVSMRYIGTAVDLSLKHGEYAVTEGDTQPVVVVARTMPGLPAPNLSLGGSIVTRAATAVSPEDYPPVSEQFEIAGAGEAGNDWAADGNRFVAHAAVTDLVLVDDDRDEPEETLSLVLGGGVPANPVWAAYAFPDGTPCDSECVSTVTIADNDDLPAVTLVLSETSITENGGESAVTATLSRPSAEETTIEVLVAPVDPAEASDFAVSVNRLLTIAAGATESTGTVTITATDNQMASDDKRITVAGVVTNEPGAADPSDVTLTIVDDDTAGVSVSPTALSVTEEDATGAGYTVVLVTEPAADVVVSVTGAESTDVAVSPSSLTFTPENWSVAQEVTVTAAADADVLNEEVRLEHAATGGGYDAVEIPEVVVTVTDNDTVPESIVDGPAAIVLSPTSLELAEGDHAAYTVKLATRPTGTVTVTVQGHAGTDLTLDTNSLAFSAANWSTAQPVDVVAAVDDDFENDEVMLTHAAAGGGYDAVTARLAVLVTDNGQPTIPPANAAPTPTDDVMETPEDTAVVIDVLANDTDPDGDLLQVTIASPPAHGAVAVVAGGIRYVPDAEYVGRDRFAYTVSDGKGLEMTASVHVTVLPVNDAPMAVGVIPEQRLEEDGEPVTLDVAPYFADVDDAALAFTAETSDAVLATVHVAGSTLTLTALVTGAVTMTVTARDAGGLTAAQTFGVHVGDRYTRAVAVDTRAALGPGTCRACGRRWVVGSSRRRPVRRSPWRVSGFR